MKIIRSIIRAFFTAFHMDVKAAESNAREFGIRCRHINGMTEGWDPKTRSWRPVKWSDIQ